MVIFSKNTIDIHNKNDKIFVKYTWRFSSMIGLVAKVKTYFFNESNVSVRNKKYTNAICLCCFTYTNEIIFRNRCR